MARHKESRTSRRGALLKAGLTATAVGAAVLGLGAAGAQAAPAAPLPLDTLAGSDAVAALGATGHVVGPLTSLQLDPLANTGVDPLDNGLGTQVADFKPVGTNLVTDHVTKGGGLDDLPVVGQVTGLLPTN
ncbi:hypothetical protein Q5762_10670 [Streptomyces sp. P9(2023)]|uniref:hypothetical protein n=1 Tax=Streptomyces sp. P9(2023) TaxID=3064394 RepID=UPI0028F3F7B8|nr:hypothetical protein [Streptomyces sp. P9(2023)]MDT9688814.1 hypothetical protein [Streptomyces sp. P9(2023)]